MNNTAKVIVALVAVAVIAGGAVLLGNKKSENSGNQTNNTPTSSDEGSNTNQLTQTDKISATIIYTNSGFSPASVTVPAGSTIRIANQSDDTIMPSSDPHPVHTDNPELNFSDIAPGENATKVLTTKGTWGYHNHYKEDNHATITVE